MKNSRTRPDLLKWSPSERHARRIVRLFLKLVESADCALLELGAPEVESLIALIALSISRAQLEPALARREARSAARSASRSATTRRPARHATRSTTRKRRPPPKR